MRGTRCCPERVADPCEFRLLEHLRRLPHYEDGEAVYPEKPLKVTYYCVFCRRIVIEEH